MTATLRLAAIDIGTVTTRLLIADVRPDGISEVVRRTDITHLGEGLLATGRLGDDAMRRVADVIAGYALLLADNSVAAVRTVATSASRDAANGADFIRMLEVHGVTPLIIEGAREAELSFSGATAMVRGEDLLVVDGGGGSTELVLGSSTGGEGGRVIDIRAARSVDVGSRRMTERFFSADPPSRAELEAARSWAVSEFRPFFDHLDVRPQRMLSLAGTPTTLAAISMQMTRYDPARVHGFELSGAMISDLLEMLAGMTYAARLDVVGLHPQRAGVVVAGALILETVLALAGLDAMVVSEHDILYGILLDVYRDLREHGSLSPHGD